MPRVIKKLYQSSKLCEYVFARVFRSLLGATTSEPNFELIATVFEDLDSENERALGREIARGRADDRQSWKLLVKEAMGPGVGWAHRRSSKLTAWQPSSVWSPAKSRWSGRRVDMLEAHQQRSSKPRRARPHEPALLQAELRADDLAYISANQLRAASP
eukprot:5489183-Pyramimonas_sp.AAC.1